MTERCHSLSRLRLLPTIIGSLVRAGAALVASAIAIGILDFRSTTLAAAIVVVAVGVPLGAQPLLAERDLRVRTHQGALARYALDGLLGALPLRAHRAGAALRHEHAALLDEWSRARRASERTATAVLLVHLMCTYALVAILLFSLAGRGSDPSRTLLLVFLALSLPVLGVEFGVAIRQYPPLRNVVLRLLEPLSTPIDDEGEEREGTIESPNADRHPATGGVEIVLDEVTVLAGGHPILDAVDVRIAPGSHVAVVGVSGAGKSSLIGLLLGWDRPTGGTLTVDGRELRGEHLDRLRSTTVWIDPAVQLWNTSLANNLRYGAHTSPPIENVLREARLVDMTDNLPAGLDTCLGEGGGLVSGGEGQRIRLGRALHRPAARLVLLDEPFRGIERHQRTALLASCRQGWRHATLLCATHDIDQTVTFDRILVLEGGKVVEDGDPRFLAGAAGSKYRALLDDDEAVRTAFDGDQWRRLQLRDGTISAT
jgi:ATP-binding cassette subfamily B protein